MPHFNGTCPIPAGAEDYGTHGTAWKPMLYVSGACGIATAVIALSLIGLHLRRWRVPGEQRQIVRIIFSIVLYAVIAFLEIFDYKAAQWIDPIGDWYEAFGLW
jgi:hypothetical protein